MLYRPEAFEQLTDEPWDEERVRAAIRALVSDAEATFDEENLWTPVEDWDAGFGSASLPLTTLYRGASGVVWGLDVMFAVHGLGQVERWRTERGRGRYSLWAGDVGAALFAADCLDARTQVPIVDTLE